MATQYSLDSFMALEKFALNVEMAVAVLQSEIESVKDTDPELAEKMGHWDKDRKKGVK
jgi:hypothetical protein